MRQFGWFTLDEWQAIASIATAAAFVVAALGLVVGGIQLWQSSKSSKDAREQAAQAALDLARPYVIVRVDHSPMTRSILDLVIENVGNGPAFDVRLSISPDFRRAQEVPGLELSQSRLVKEPMAMLAPRVAQRWFLDSSIERKDADLPDIYTASVTYHDGRGHDWTESSVLDMNFGAGLLYSDPKTIHHVAKELEKIRNLLGER